MNSVDLPEAPVKLVPYTRTWPELFEAEAQQLQAALQPWLCAGIEHIGSTAVPGLSAKPVIDIMAPVRDLASSQSAIAVAQHLGYCYFPYKPSQMVWFCKPSPAMRTHHLHLVPWQSQLWHERLAFRDALRRDPALAQQYQMLKMQLAARYPNDREAYTDAKTPFILAVLKTWRDGLTAV